MFVNGASKMKKILAVVLTISASAVWADGYREYRYHYPRPVIVEQHSNTDVLVPLVIGGLVGAAIANQNQPQPVPQQPQVIIQREPVVVQPQTVCSGWKEIQTPDGQIYRERTCYLR
jgi:hypothetical protein